MRKWSLESTSKSRDWERHLCELVDKIVASPSEQYEHMEVLIEDVEDLVISAYLRGIEAGKKKADIA